jgi:2',3'-cyclic-nucleotide 2'-phosphodiesterase (5'-nucleotidase family)
VKRWVGILVCMVAVAALRAQEVRLQVLATSDLHGHVLAQDSFTLQPANQGWSRLATLVRGLRAANPNTLLVDCGDATQGDPLDYVWAQLKPNLPEPNMAILNALGCNAMVVGGREFAQGVSRLRGMEDQAQFPWLAANVVFASDGRLVFTPYALQNVGGVQVAILGLATPPPSRPDAPDAGALVFQDPVATAKAFMNTLRQKEKADMVVVALHTGPGGACAEDSAARCLAAQVPGIDLILLSHTRVAATGDPDGTPVLQAGAGGSSLGVAEFVYRKAGRNRWELASRRTRQAPAGPDTAQDPAVLDLTAPLRTATEAYLNTFATTLGTDLDARWARMEDTPVMHLLHTVARQATGAQITALATPPSHLFIPKGATSVRQFYALSPGEERLARIRVTGKQLRAYLEQAGRFYGFSHNPELFNRNADPGDFDTLEGCSYVLDISRPPGSRVLNLQVQDQPVKDDQSFTLGLAASRLAGSGGYVDAMGWSGKPEAVSPVLFRNQLLDYVLARPTLAPAAGAAWRIVPALDRERVLAQQP